MYDWHWLNNIDDDDMMMMMMVMVMMMMILVEMGGLTNTFASR